MLGPEDFFLLEGFDHRALFTKNEPVWTALDRLKDYLHQMFQKHWPLSKTTGQITKPLVLQNGEVRDDIQVSTTGPDGALQVMRKGEILEDVALILPGAYLFDDRIFIGPGTIVEPGAFIKGPAVIGRRSQIRQGAYIRGDCIVGDGCVVGHTTEMKASIFLNGAKAGHFAYIGDSILGRDVNLGAGTKLANLKMIPGSISIAVEKK